MNSAPGTNDVELVRSATDLVRLIGEHVALRPRGREYVGLCPFHDDKNPSFAVVTHKGNAFYKCHACGAGGDAFDFVRNYHKMEFGEALRFLADRAGITLRPRSQTAQASNSEAANSRTSVRKANAFAAAFFRRTFADPQLGAASREIVRQRGISDEMVEAFMIGAAPDQWDALSRLIERRDLPAQAFAAAGLLKQRTRGGDDGHEGAAGGHYDAFRNRLIFPICDELGNPIAFGGRKIKPEDEPKYLNSSESAAFSKSRVLYGLNLAKRAIIDRKEAIVTEGYTDVIACHQAGFRNVVATLGTALTREHAQILSRLCDRIVLLFDGDEAGQKAGSRGFETLASHFGLSAFFHERIDVAVCVLPDDLDPDELLGQADGRARFESLLASAPDVLDFIFDRFRRQLGMAEGMSARQKAVESFLLQLADLGFNRVQGLRRGMILNRLSELLDLSPSVINASIPAPRQSHHAADPSGSTSNGVEDSGPAGAASLRMDDPSNGEANPARLRAERDLLGLLVFQPELMEESVNGSNDAALAASAASSPLRLIDQARPDQFIDPVHRAIAEVVLAFGRGGRGFTVQELLDRCETQAARSLASSLYFDGERLCSNPTLSASEILRSVAAGFQAHISLRQLEQTVSSFHECKDAPDQALHAARAVLEHRRRQSSIAGAIGRGGRA